MQKKPQKALEKDHINSYALYSCFSYDGTEKENFLQKMSDNLSETLTKQTNE